MIKIYLQQFMNSNVWIKSWRVKFLMKLLLSSRFAMVQFIMYANVSNFLSVREI